jgi:hypothetical protein
MYEVGMAYKGITFSIPCFMIIGQLVQKLNGGKHTHAEHDHLISLPSFLVKKEK